MYIYNIIIIIQFFVSKSFFYYLFILEGLIYNSIDAPELSFSLISFNYLILNIPSILSLTKVIYFSIPSIPGDS